MAMFATAEEHAANPPGTWQAVKAAERIWHLRTASGTTLDTFRTRRDAEQARTSGHSFDLWHKLTRWHQGHTPAGWKTYAEVCAERERNEAAQAQFRAIRAAGYTDTYLDDPAPCAAGGHELPTERPAWGNGDGRLWCRAHLAGHLTATAAA